MNNATNKTKGPRNRVGSREFVRRLAAELADDLRYWDAETQKYGYATYGRRTAEAHACQISRILSKIPKAYRPNAAIRHAAPDSSPLKP